MNKGAQRPIQSLRQLVNVFRRHIWGLPAIRRPITPKLATASVRNLLLAHSMKTLTQLSLPQGTCLGNLSFVILYEFTDAPRLFVARNRAGAQYLAYWIGEDATEEDDRACWIYVGISPMRKHALEAGEVAVRDAFLWPEDSCVFEARSGDVKMRKPGNLRFAIAAQLPPNKFIDGWQSLPTDAELQQLARAAVAHALTQIHTTLNGSDAEKWVHTCGALTAIVSNLEATMQLQRKLAAD